jgi:hypothetical protein
MYEQKDRESPIEFVPTVNPKTAWKGRLLKRIAPIASFIVTEVGQAFGALWTYWQGWPLATILFVSTTLFLGTFGVLYRRSRIHEIQCDSAYHDVFHAIREQHARFKDENLERAKQARFESFMKEVAEKSAAIFRLKKRDPEVNCCIRLLYQRGYTTVARSSGLHPDRDRHSVPLGVNQGVARKLHENYCVGHYMVYSIKEATARGDWAPSPNDQYEDIRSVIVIPINGYYPEGQGVLRKYMIGLLYMTSPTEYAFDEPDALPGQAIADYLGTLLPTMVKLHIASLPRRNPHQ